MVSSPARPQATWPSVTRTSSARKSPVDLGPLLRLPRLHWPARRYDGLEPHRPVLYGAAACQPRPGRDQHTRPQNVATPPHAPPWLTVRYPATGVRFYSRLTSPGQRHLRRQPTHWNRGLHRHLHTPDTTSPWLASSSIRFRASFLSRPHLPPPLFHHCSLHLRLPHAPPTTTLVLNICGAASKPHPRPGSRQLSSRQQPLRHPRTASLQHQPQGPSPPRPPGQRLCGSLLRDDAGRFVHWY